MFLKPDLSIEQGVAEKGHALFGAMGRVPGPGLFSRKGAYRRLMEWCMRDPAFKGQLFRFVDALPTLGSSREVVRLMEEYLGESVAVRYGSLRGVFRLAGMAPGVAAAVVRWQMRDFAKQFVAGATTHDLLRVFRRNTRDGLATTVDLLGEAVLSEAEAGVFLERNLQTLDAMAAAVRKQPEGGLSDHGSEGPLPRVNLSIKISALSPAIRVEAPEASLVALKQRLRPILRRAKELGAFVNFDMESTHLKALTLELFRSVLEEPEFADGPEVGIALQAYLRSAEEDLAGLVQWARQRQRRIGVRLVKGAYWDYEVTLARQRNWPEPVWPQKAMTDACYEKMTVSLLESLDVVEPAFASHSVRSVAHAIVQAEARGVPRGAYEFQALYGMADDLKAALVGAGYRVREYCPVGELLPGMAYLVRRLLENTSNEGFLTAQLQGTVALEELLANPVKQIHPPARTPTLTQPPGVVEFRNAPNLDFTIAEVRERFQTALNRRAAETPRRWPLVIGGERRMAERLLPSVNPARPSEEVGFWSCATVEQAAEALAAARAAWPGWAATPVAKRVAVIRRVADLMEERRFDLAALEVLEAGKPWSEADADIAEAIDFCRFYSMEMERLDGGEITQSVPGEWNRLLWRPRGCGVIIAPWNFPLAILCGMATAALVAGNTVVLKPAEQTSIIGAVFMDLLEEAGLPPGVGNLITGIGEEVGAHLAADERTDFIAFTGSRPVGTKLWETAATLPSPGQSGLKKVICEMGGKNAVVVDSSADPDEAIPAVLYSAFGFSGQKCSALSRLIVMEEIHDTFVARLIEAARALPMGDPAQPWTFMGPVIDEDAYRRILTTIERGKAEARLAWQGSRSSELAEEGYFVPPTIFTHVSPGSFLAREEIFGPVLAVFRARDANEALRLANDSEYALTGGVFSRSPAMLERARREFQVGNLYLNRGITGAIVERHPFGGFRMSGAGTKAGGREYLKEFLLPRVISENMIRRGFSPEEEA